MFRDVDASFDEYKYATAQKFRLPWVAFCACPQNGLSVRRSVGQVMGRRWVESIIRHREGNMKAVSSGLGRMGPV